MLQTALRQKACAVCKGPFVPFQSMQIVCSPGCARRVPILARKRLIAEKRRDRARLEAMKPLSHWTRLAQEQFNAWIRARDVALPCISCGRLHGGKVNAGHYLSTGARPELRFDEQNVHKQCEPCNTSLAGNLILYRIELLRRIGPAAVERLEGPHEPKKYTREQLQAIRDDYRARLKALTL